MDGPPTAAAPAADRPAVVDIDADLFTRALRHPSGAAGWLLQHREGNLQAELTEALAKLLLACAENDKPGEITLKIRAIPNPDYAGQMVISDQVSVKLPPRATAVPYLFDQDLMQIAPERPGQQLTIPLAP
jgi:hypothetical protein